MPEPSDLDRLDGCSVVQTLSVIDPTPDEDVQWLALFASVLEEGDEAVLRRAEEWLELFGGGE